MKPKTRDRNKNGLNSFSNYSTNQLSLSHLIVPDRRVPAFLRHLWECVSDSRKDTIICWSTLTSNTFVIRDPIEFTEKELNKIVKPSSYKYFIHKLDEFGFIPSIKEENAFSHEYFVRNNPSLLSKITKRPIETAQHTTQSARSVAHKAIEQYLESSQTLEGTKSPITLHEYFMSALKPLLQDAKMSQQTTELLEKEVETAQRRCANMKVFVVELSKLIGPESEQEVMSMIADDPILNQFDHTKIIEPLLSTSKTSFDQYDTNFVTDINTRNNQSDYKLQSDEEITSSDNTTMNNNSQSLSSIDVNNEQTKESQMNDNYKHIKYGFGLQASDDDDFLPDYRNECSDIHEVSHFGENVSSHEEKETSLFKIEQKTHNIPSYSADHSRSTEPIDRDIRYVEDDSEMWVFNDKMNRD